jgi:hypothetical protein
MKFDRTQLGKIDNTKFKNSIKANDRNSIRNKSADLKQSRPTTRPAGGKQVKDVRSSTLEGLKSKPGGKVAKPGQGAAAKPIDRKPAAGKIDRPVGKAKPGARPDTRPKNASPIGEVKRGKDTKIQSNRGAKSMGGGIKKPGGGGGASHKQIKRPKGGGGRGGRGRR